MGRVWLRMPANKTNPEHWRLISTNLDGPFADGQLKLKVGYQGGTANGTSTWAAHSQRFAPDARLLQLRNRDDSDWLPALWMSPAKNFYTLQYGAAEFFDSPRFIEQTGWRAEHRNNIEFAHPSFPGLEKIDDSGGYTMGDIYYGFPNSGGTASARSMSGWVGNEANTHGRYTEETLIWYSLPIGMFIEKAEETRLVTKINEPDSWAGSAALHRVDVVARMSGYSVDKRQLPWMNRYTYGETTNFLRQGVGSLRYLGATPRPERDDVIPGPPAEGGPYTTWINTLWNNGIYTVPALRDLEFERISDGDIIWAGLLNDLGVRQEYHGIPPTPEYQVIQSFNITSYDARDAVTYQWQTAPVPDPDPIVWERWHTMENAMTVAFYVRVIYAF